MKAVRLVLLPLLLLPLISCSGAREAGREAAGGAFDALEQRVDAKVEKLSDKLDARVAAAQAKPESERTPLDWILILLAGGGGSGLLSTLAHRYLIGKRQSPVVDKRTPL